MTPQPAPDKKIQDLQDAARKANADLHEAMIAKAAKLRKMSVEEYKAIVAEHGMMLAQRQQSNVEAQAPQIEKRRHEMMAKNLTAHIKGQQDIVDSLKEQLKPHLEQKAALEATKSDLDKQGKAIAEVKFDKLKGEERAAAVKTQEEYLRNQTDNTLALERIVRPIKRLQGMIDSRQPYIEKKKAELEETNKKLVEVNRQIAAAAEKTVKK